MACCLIGAKPSSEPMLEYCLGTLGTNVNEILIKIHTFSFKKIHLKMSSGKWRPFCLGLKVLKLKSQRQSRYEAVVQLVTDDT